VQMLWGLGVLTPAVALMHEMLSSQWRDTSEPPMAARLQQHGVTFQLRPLLLIEQRCANQLFIY
jgi:hypothetical protein